VAAIDQPALQRYSQDRMREDIQLRLVLHLYPHLSLFPLVSYSRTIVCVPASLITLSPICVIHPDFVPPLGTPTSSHSKSFSKTSGGQTSPNDVQRRHAKISPQPSFNFVGKAAINGWYRAHTIFCGRGDRNGSPVDLTGLIESCKMCISLSSAQNKEPQARQKGQR